MSVRGGYAYCQKQLILAYIYYYLFDDMNRILFTFFFCFEESRQLNDELNIFNLDVNLFENHN